MAATFRVITRGASFDRLIDETVRDLKAANRTAAREIAKVGKKAIREKAPKVGKKLGSKTRTRAFPDRAEVTFRANTVGGWMLHEKGAKPHAIYPNHRGRNNRRPALKFGVYAAHVNHPGTSGTGAWTKAVARLKVAVRPAIVDVYNDALGN